MSESTFVDINNLGLEEEPLGEEFDANANAFSGPPPLMKGTYVVDIAFREADPSKQFEKKQYRGKSGSYLATKLVGTVVQPEDKAGRKIFDDFVSTGIWRDETSTVASLLHLLGRSDEVKAATNHEDLARSLSLALASNPRVRMRVDWKGRIKNPTSGEYEDLYKTMTDFKQRDDGSYDPNIYGEDGVTVIGRAQLKVRGYSAAPGVQASAA